LTSSPLAAAVASGTFRAELLAALSAIPLLLPPLAERTHDILPLARGFLRLHGGPDSPLLEPAARQALLRHTWPGNARELEIALRGALAQTAPGARYVRLSAIEA